MAQTSSGGAAINSTQRGEKHCLKESAAEIKYFFLNVLISAIMVGRGNLFESSGGKKRKNFKPHEKIFIK